MSWIVSTLAASTVLMLVVLALRRPVAAAFGPRVAYALWLLPALRMVLPPLPETVAPALPVRLDVATLLRLAEPTPAQPQGHDWATLLIALWLGVALLWFGRALLAYRRFMARTLAGGSLLRRERGVAVWLGGGDAGPLAAGVFARAIVLPRDFHVRFGADEQRLALAHEAAHHARFDTLANAVALAVRALHWWNPVAHVAWRAFRADQELACDACVLRDASPEERHAYGSAVLKAAFGGVPAAACGMRQAGELKRRLAMMARARRLPAGLGHALAGAAIVGGLALTATGGAAAERVKAIGERVRDALPPPPPLAPLAPLPPAPPLARSLAGDVPDAPPAPPPPVGRRAVPVPPVSAAPPVPPVPSVPPVPPVPPMSRADAEAARAAAEAGRAAAEAGRVAAEAARAAVAAIDMPRLIETSVAAARAEMIASCAERGTPVARNETDWGTLALCNRAAIHAQIRAALAQARVEVAAAHTQMDAAQRERALAAIDRALARTERGGVTKR